MKQRFGIRLCVLLLVPLMALGMVAFAAGGDKPAVEPGLQVAKTGLVLDARTHQPLTGAYVVARWLEQSTSPGTVEGQCLFRTVVRTDEQGQYVIPATGFTIAPERSSAARKYFWDAYAYVPGYAAAGNETAHPRAVGSAIPASQAMEPILLVPDQVEPEQRMINLTGTLSRFACQPYAKDAGAVAEQVYAEAYAAACLPEPNGTTRMLARLHDERPGVQPESEPESCAHLRQASNAP